MLIFCESRLKGERGVPWVQIKENELECLGSLMTSDYKTQIIKHVSSTLSEVLCPIINASLLHGVFPSLLKTAKVVPIHKSGKKHDVANFRPISLLSTFSKIYEKVMYRGVQPRLRPRLTKFCLSGIGKNGQEWSKMFFP